LQKIDFSLERKRHRDEDNRRFILKAAERVFLRKGFNLSSVDDIVLEGHISKATIYRYFKSKVEIFVEIVTSYFEEMNQKAKRIAHSERSAEEKLRDLIYIISSLTRKKLNITRSLFLEWRIMRKAFDIKLKNEISPETMHPSISYEIKKVMEQVFKIMCEVIEEGVKGGEFRQVDVEDAAFVLSSLLRGFHFRGPLIGKNYSLKRSTDLIHEVFLKGIKKC